MNIFLIAKSRTGKSTIARWLVSKGYTHISGSEWVKSIYPNMQLAEKDRAAYIEDISTFSKEQLKKDPMLNIRHIEEKYDWQNQPCVFDGFRNPKEFLYFFRPHLDKVIFLKIDAIQTLGLDSGVDVIESILEWYKYLFDFQYIIFNLDVNTFHDDWTVIPNIIKQLETQMNAGTF